MQKKFRKLWYLAIPYLNKGTGKNFVTHTKWVTYAMEELLKEEAGDKNILIPSAILHDIGWSKVPSKLQNINNSKSVALDGLRLHIKYAPKLIKEILSQVDYSPQDIKTISEIVVSHKFCKPRRLDKRLLIDADTLSDTYKECFYSDLKSYHKTPQEQFEFRRKNQFYTTTAQRIFVRELSIRKKEIIGHDI